MRFRAADLFYGRLGLGRTAMKSFCFARMHLQQQQTVEADGLGQMSRGRKKKTATNNPRSGLV